MLTSDFLNAFGSSPNFQGGKNPFRPLQTLTNVDHRISLKNIMSLKKFQVIWQP